jgi:signal transduction histidine kinase
VVVAFAALPFRSEFGLPGFLFCGLLAVLAVALMGGARPVFAAIVVGMLLGAYLFARPYGSLEADSAGDIAGLVAFVVVGGALGILVDDLTQLAAEQAALRRVATLVARGTPPTELFAAVTEEVGKLLPVDFAGIGRYESDDTVTTIGVWSTVAPLLPVGSRRHFGRQDISTIVSETGRATRIERYADASGPAAVGARETSVRSSAGTPILVEGRLWGVMAVGTAERPLPRGIEARLQHFTDLVATAIANAESRAALAASRARIVATADETRQRIERDLHDGTQQRLVSLALELRGAQAAMPPELGELQADLSRIVEGLASVLEELRETARGIHPAILAEGGLEPALKTLARRCPIPVELRVRAGARPPERVEVAAYYVVSEALTNTAKHARASVVHVEVETVERVLRVAVTDDGAGGADAAKGSGLIGLRDRVEALGGAISVESPLGGGTSVLVKLPFSELEEEDSS